MAEYISAFDARPTIFPAGLTSQLYSLEKMIGWLEAYLATAPPSTPLGDPGEGGSSAGG